MKSIRLLSLAATLLLLPVASGAKPLKTGQKKCWDASGNAIACAGTGHDGALRQGAKRAYVDNGDGTITDKATGLVWEKLDDSGGIHDKDKVYTWAAATADKIAALNTPPCFAGQCDWRLPNVNELRSLVDYQRFPSISAPFDKGCAAGCTTATCSCTLQSDYWSSTTYQPEKDSAWVVYFAIGYTIGFQKPNSESVRAVRGGS